VGDGRVLVVHVSNCFAHFSKNLEYLRLRYRLSLLAVSVQCLHQVFAYNKAMAWEKSVRRVELTNARPQTRSGNDAVKRWATIEPEQFSIRM
jgi:hypothetical protein